MWFRIVVVVRLNEYRHFSYGHIHEVVANDVNTDKHGGAHLKYRLLFPSLFSSFTLLHRLSFFGEARMSERTVTSRVGKMLRRCAKMHPEKLINATFWPWAVGIYTVNIGGGIKSTVFRREKIERSDCQCDWIFMFAFQSLKARESVFVALVYEIKISDSSQNAECCISKAMDADQSHFCLCHTIPSGCFHFRWIWYETHKYVSVML
jgi:hypothetical protein